MTQKCPPAQPMGIFYTYMTWDLVGMIMAAMR